MCKSMLSGPIPRLNFANCEWLVKTAKGRLLVNIRKCDVTYLNAASPLGITGK
jgi:hypothetical protein